MLEPSYGRIDDWEAGFGGRDLRHGADSLNWCWKKGSVSSVRTFPSLWIRKTKTFRVEYMKSSAQGVPCNLHQRSMTKRVALLEHEV